MTAIVKRGLLSTYVSLFAMALLYKMKLRYIILDKLRKSQNRLKTEVKKVSQTILPPRGIGNEFLPPEPAALTPVVMARPVSVSVPASVLGDVEVGLIDKPPRRSRLKALWELAHRYSLATFALLFLIVGTSAAQVVAAYESARFNVAATSRPSGAVHIPRAPLQGPNLIVASSQLSQTLQNITGQPLNLNVGSQTVALAPTTIKSWLQLVDDRPQGVAYIHVNKAAISKSLSEATAAFNKAPVNQVTVTRPDGSSQVIAGGRNGSAVGDLSAFTDQINQNLLSAKGMQFNVPIQTQAFATTPASSIAKLIEVNVVSKQMYLYDNGQLTRQYPISAGAPITPTPIGQYKIYQKFAVQDMKGFNPDGSKYFQPHVHWINYFLPGGYAVHGNYWRPLSWFGAINSSHGCVSLPDDQAEWVYNWAPIGTTVITHY